MNKWIESYANHALYCSLYTGMAAYSLKLSRPSSSSSSPSSSSPITWNILPLVVGGFAALNLCAEINYIFKRIGLPPGSSGYPILGQLVEYLAAPRLFLLRHKEKFGDPCILNGFGIPLVIFSSDDDVRWAIAQERKGNLVPSIPDYMKDLIGRESIMLQFSTNHRRLRRIFEPSFSPTAIKEYAQKIDDTIKAELEKWFAKSEFCSTADWAVLAMRLFFVCAFGDMEEQQLLKLHKLFTAWSDGFAAVPISIPGTAMYRSQKAGRELTTILQDMIDEFKLKNPQGSQLDESSMMARLCYAVDDDGNPLTNEQLVTNIRFIMFAGHDTTKGSFGAFAHYLVEYPKLRVMLIDEVKSFSDPLNINELKGAPLLNAFMAETWRMMPPTDVHAMEAAVDLEYKGYKIRKGVAVAVDITSDCVTNGRFVDPLEFRVERWLPKGHPLHDPKYYLDGIDYNLMSVKYRAFNMGAHMCLGAHFAKLEARIVLTRLLQNYDIEIQNDKLFYTRLLQYSNDFKIKKR